MLVQNPLRKFVNQIHIQFIPSPITKGEYIGHVQKRVGTCLCKLKADYKGKMLNNGKSIGGEKGRLLNKVMNTLRNQVGMAI